MPSRCWILGCPSNVDRSQTKFFKFPQNENVKNLWVQAIKRDVAPTDSSRVCSKHFTPDDYKLSLHSSKDLNDDLIISSRRLHLKPEAVPSVFEGINPRCRKKKSSPTNELNNSQSPLKDVAQELSPSMKPENKTTPPKFQYTDSADLEKNIDTSTTTDKPIITVIKAQDLVVEDLSSDEEFTPEKLKSPIIKVNSKKIPNDLPSPYKHLPAVSVCLKEEDRVVIPQDPGKSLKRTSSTCSNSSSGGGASELQKAIPQPKRRKIDKPAPIVIGRQNDCYCWVCHRENIVLCCIACPRAYHQKCAGEVDEPSDWVCPECQKILTAENVDTRSTVLSEISLDKLCALLRFCLNKMKHRAGVAFHQPVSLDHYPMYLHYIIHPMDFSLLEKNIKQKLYGCTEAFLSDVKWIMHNSCVFNGSQHPLSTNAKTLVKTCENDMQEIEVCPDCFMHSVIRNKYWFADVCRKPHPLVWAKLKGFPYWPAKVVRILDGNVDARFFGAHDRAWVPITQCYHLSKEMPTTSKPKKKGNYETALDELNVHVQLLIQKFGTFEYAPCRTTFDPKNKFFMYHGIDIDKIDKDEIPFDSSITAKNKEYCSSPIAERISSTETKIDIEQSDEVSSNSLLSMADVRSSRISSCDEEKAVLSVLKGKSECNISSESINEKTEVEQTVSNKNSNNNISEDLSLTKSQSSSIPRDKLELALERIKGYVSIDNEEEKEPQTNEDISEKLENVSKTDISKSETSSILAGLIKSKTLPKIDLPDIPVSEAEVSPKENPSFLDMSKKNDTFNLHLLETIKKAQLRTAAEDDDSSDDVETLDKNDSDSDYVEDEDEEEEEEEDEQKSEEENESNDLESEHDKEEKENVTETIDLSDDDEEEDVDESSSESETSSESSGTDIEEIEIEDQNNSTINDTEVVKDSTSKESAVNDKEMCDANSDDDDRMEVECLSSENISKETNSDQLSGLKEGNITSAQEILPVAQENKCVEKNSCEDKQVSNEQESVDILESNADNLDEDDEIIIYPPVKPPTPPLICLDDGTETEPENDDGLESKVAEKSSSLLQSNSSLPFSHSVDIASKPSVVRKLKFGDNKPSNKGSTIEKKSISNALNKRNQSKKQLSESSSDESSEEDCLVVNRENGIPLSGARRTFNILKNRTSTPAINTTETMSCDSRVLSLSSPISRLPVRRSSKEKTPENIREQINMEQDFTDGSPQDAVMRNASTEEMEILRLKKKLSAIFTAFQLSHWKNTQEKSEIRHNMNLIVMEMRASLEADKKQSMETLRRTFEREKQRCIEETKKNQWCASCFREARYQCCWNTNYCTVACQKQHFSVHKKLCTQLKNKVNMVTNDAKISPHITNETKDGKKVYVVNMVPKVDNKLSGDLPASGNMQQVTIAKSQIQVIPPKPTLSLIQSTSTNTSTQIQIVPNTNTVTKYILAPAPQQQVTTQENKQLDSSDIIRNVRSKNCNLSTAISLLNKKNLETEASIKKDESKAEEQDLEEIYFPSPPQVNFEGLDTASPDESILISQLESSEKNSSDTEISSQGEKIEDSSAEEDLIFSDNDEADNELVNIGNGVEVKAKFLNKCLIYGKTPKRLTRCLVDVLFPDIKLLASCSAFGQKSNVTKLTRAALPAKKVAAILDYVQKRYPTATRTEIVLAINLKCKEARNIVGKQDDENLANKNLFRRLLARDQNLETNKTASPIATSNASPAITSTVSPTNIKPPVTTVTVMRQPPAKRICVKPPPLPIPQSTDASPSTTTKLTPRPNVFRCSPQVLIRPRFTQPVATRGAANLPRIARQTVRTLLAGSSSVVSVSKEPKKLIMPLEVFKQSPVNIQPASTTGNSQRPLIIIGASSTSTPQSLSVTQPSSLPSSILRK